MLNADGIADRLEGADQGHENKGRQERPEDRAEAQVEARPGAGGKPDPRGIGDPRRIVEAEITGDAAGDRDTDHRRPQAQRSGRLQGDPHHQENGDQGAQRGGGGGRAFRDIAQHLEDDRHDRDGNQHDHGAGDGRGENSPEQGEARGKRELEQGRDDDEGGEHSRPALGDRGDTDRDEGAGGAHQKDIAGADAS